MPHRFVFPFPSSHHHTTVRIFQACCDLPGARRSPSTLIASIDWRQHRDKGRTMSRANEMFRADSRMMVVFGAFTSKSEPPTFEESLRFVKKVKARNYMLYLSLFDILGRIELSQLDAYQELQLLFQNHPDLCEELEKFRPPVPTKHAANSIWPWVFVCAVPLVAVSLIPALGNPVLWFVQQTLGEKMTA